MKTLVVAGLALLLAGCGSASGSPSASPSTRSPETVFGSALAFGQTARVRYEPNPARSGDLDLTVTSAVQAPWSDFTGFGLGAVANQTAYYVSVTVRNSGTTDLGGAGIPLWAVDSADHLVQAAAFATSFARCPSLPLPTSFRPREHVDTCLVYILRTPISSVVFRSATTGGTITWVLPVSSPTASPVLASPTGAAS